MATTRCLEPHWRRLSCSIRILRVTAQLPISSDDFVPPKVYENISNSLLEVGAAGLPVIATAMGGNQEIVEDGRTGVLVPPHDPKALAEAIIDLATDISLRQHFGRRLQQHIRTNFSEEAVFRKYSDLYRELIEAGR